MAPGNVCARRNLCFNEVGIDIEADHMVSDLVAWERMVQRPGRQRPPVLGWHGRSSTSASGQ